MTRPEGAQAVALATVVVHRGRLVAERYHDDVDGSWDGQRLLPEGWVDHARRPIPVRRNGDDHDGAHWWLWEPDRTVFAAHGYEGQHLVGDPGRDVVLVRLGKTPAERAVDVRRWSSSVVGCFPAA